MNCTYAIFIFSFANVFIFAPLCRDSTAENRTAVTVQSVMVTVQSVTVTVQSVTITVQSVTLRSCPMPQTRKIKSGLVKVLVHFNVY